MPSSKKPSPPSLPSRQPHPRSPTYLPPNLSPPSTLPTTPFLNPQEVCSLLHISRHTLNHWRGKGKGPKAVKFEGKVLRWERSEVERWLVEQKANSDRGER